jgi:hypothetical protein
MKRTAFFASTVGAVSGVVLLASTLGGGGSVANALSLKKTPTPTPTTSQPPVEDGQGCFQITDGSFFWHRDIVAGTPQKLNAGEFGATLWLGAGMCTHETYRFQLLDGPTGTQVLETVNVLGSWDRANVSSVTVTKFLHMEASDAVDALDTYSSVRVQTQILDGTGTVVFSSLPGGLILTDGDENTSPATAPYR